MSILKKPKITELLENELDFDFKADIEKINSIEDFYDKIIYPSAFGKKIFYRGERLNSFNRTLLPSIYRDKTKLFNDKTFASNVNAETIIDFYNNYPEYTNMYQDIIGKIEVDNLYPFLSVSQHYLGISPLIDFTKSPYVAMSFSLKNRKEFLDDIVIYTLEILSDNDYTNSLEQANLWLKNYDVLVFDTPNLQNHEKTIPSYQQVKMIAEELKNRTLWDLNVPTAKLIDVPTNDLMLFQQGVFLLLDDFTLVGKGYLTKKIRDEFSIKKYVINKDICPNLLQILMTEKPYYNYLNITDLNKVVKELKKRR